MSLYNNFFGVHAQAHTLLKALGITPGDVPCFRDCYLDDGKMVIHTRAGGRNREYHEEEIKKNLQKFQVIFMTRMISILCMQISIIVTQKNSKQN